VQIKDQEEAMPRLRYIEESEKTACTRELIESAKRTGAPDPSVISLMTRGKLGIAWVEYWKKLLYHGVLPHKRSARPSVTQGYIRVARLLSRRECPVPEDKPTLRGHRDLPIASLDPVPRYVCNPGQTGSGSNALKTSKMTQMRHQLPISLRGR
jgi:hypothetical protein